DDAPETHSERMFDQLEGGYGITDPVTGRRRGLKAAMTSVREWRRERTAAKRVAKRAA
ncbi:MAG: fatty acid desaturase, partial [Mycolicibacterium mageritense]